MLIIIALFIALLLADYEGDAKTTNIE